jgi:hypothetical protein
MSEEERKGMLLDAFGRHFYAKYDLYQPMMIFAVKYRWIVRVGVFLAALGAAYALSQLL